MLRKEISYLLVVLMVLGTAGCGKIKTLEEWYEINVSEIKSLDSDDYSDLEFLKPLLKDKRVVAIGENFQGVGDYIELKTRLVKYLHEELGFNAIGLESGLGECIMSLNNNNLSAKQMMEYSIMPTSYSEEALDLFTYIKEQKDTEDPLDLFGFDMEFTSIYFAEYLKQWIEKVDKEVAEDYYELEINFLRDYSELLNKYGYESTGYLEKYQKVIDRYSADYDDVIKFIKDNREELEAIYRQNDLLVDSALRTLGNRMNIVRMSMVGTVKRYELRNEIMADNVKWYMDANPDKKIIIWGHNDNITKNTSKMLTLENDEWSNSFVSMGEILSQKFPRQVYVMGLYMQGGKALHPITNEIIDIPPVPTGSLEEIISRRGYETTFVDLSKNRSKNKFNKWMFTNQYASDDGLTYEIEIRSNVQQLVPKDQYDGIILFDNVSPLTHMK
ncbi:putative hydrolase YbfO [Vallitalea longa]|uniref:Hydrolase YbfO n=1 Tax=Vallitalea longa TaxID=2936439 RepID=A0A9W5Y7W7_9FIRM|nr:erythromycin esterase family protein [Vallitalea longa]GKX28317.1 putative hydrolase YbfO [Vallitalea longa]